MIDVVKWERMNDEQKLQLCKSIKEGIDLKIVVRDDWQLIFEFLLKKVLGK